MVISKHEKKKVIYSGKCKKKQTHNINKENVNECP